MVIRQHVTLELAALDVIPESEQRVKCTDVAAMMGKQTLTRYEVRFTVAVEVAEFHSVELAEILLDPVCSEAAFTTGIDDLFEPGRTV